MHAVTRGVFARDRQSRCGHIDRVDLRWRMLQRKRDRDAAAARADVDDDRGAPISRRTASRGLDEQLGLWPWNQHGGRDHEVASPELLHAADVGDRLAGQPPRDERS